MDKDRGSMEQILGNFKHWIILIWKESLNSVINIFLRIAHYTLENLDSGIF